MFIALRAFFVLRTVYCPWVYPFRAKKPAKLQLFSDMTKYFCKKNQKNAFLHALFGNFLLFLARGVGGLPLRSPGYIRTPIVPLSFPFP